MKKSDTEQVIIPTLNHRGYMTTYLDSFSQDFVDYAGQCKSQVLDMGAAYGVATIAALNKGASVVAVDMDSRHLAEIELSITASEKNRLTTITGVLPKIDFPDNSFVAILCSRVLHFLLGEEITQSFQLFYKWLKPGGKLYVITETPYCGIWRDIIPIYEERKKNNEAWPAFMPDFKKFMNKNAELKVAPDMLNPLDLWQLEKLAVQSGFNILKSSYISRHDFPEFARYDGRESAGIIVSK
jgi:SAM-dependent methyltransferase